MPLFHWADIPPRFAERPDRKARLVSAVLLLLMLAAGLYDEVLARH